jgi:hypothetical protein
VISLRLRAINLRRPQRLSIVGCGIPCREVSEESR